MKSELERLIGKRVIESVSEPTYWVNGLALVVKKNGKLQICLARGHEIKPSRLSIFS